MIDPVESIKADLNTTKDLETPPLHLWHPRLSGDIDIRIESDGSWYHEGRRIERESLVRLFAGILRREEDNHYYLVTPNEKWRIEVELHPLIVIDFERISSVGPPVLLATLNTHRRIEVGEKFPLYLDPRAGNVAVLRLPYGITALSSRAAWYRLVELAEEHDSSAVLKSGEFVLRLPIT